MVMMSYKSETLQANFRAKLAHSEVKYGYDNSKTITTNHMSHDVTFL